MRGRVADELEADRRHAGLGRGLVDGTDAEVIDLDRPLRCRDLVRRMGREPDEHVRTDRCAHRRGRLVVLSHVHSVGAARERHLDPVVDHEQRARVVACGPQLPPGDDQLVIARLLVAQL